MTGALGWLVLACASYLALVFAVDVVLLLAATVENAVRARQRRVESLEALRSSRFALPVSVIVPVHNEEAVVVPVVRSLLAFEYPELEVVVVNDGSSDATLDLLTEAFHLEPRALFARQVFSRGEDPVTYRSRLDGRLTVVDRPAGGGSKAAALNYGLDFSRYPYVLCVDGDTLYRPDALLRAMAAVHRDPSVVGVTGRIGVSTHPERAAAGEPGDERSLLGLFQHLEYLRAFLNDRLAWSRLGFMLCTSGAFMLWRRDVLEEAGGFSPEFSCEDIEITFRVHELMLRRRRRYRVVSVPDLVAVTEIPASLPALAAQRARWQRVTLETVWHYRRLIGRPRYGPVGLAGAPFFLVSEALAPLFELLGVASAALALGLGVFDWRDYVVLLLLVCFANAVLTTAAVWLEEAAAPTCDTRRLVLLLLLGPLEILLYRPILLWARLKGTIGFLRGDRAWAKFERNARAAVPTRPTLASG